MARTTNHQQHLLRVKHCLVSRTFWAKKFARNRNLQNVVRNDNKRVVQNNNYQYLQTDINQEQQNAKTLLETTSCKIWRRKNDPKGQIAKSLARTTSCQKVVRNNNVQMCCLERQIAKSYPQQQPKKWHLRTIWKLCKEKCGNNILQKMWSGTKICEENVVLNSNLQKCYLVRLFEKENNNYTK